MLCSLLLTIGTLLAVPDFDRDAAGQQVLVHLSALIEINTTNATGADPDPGRPNGNELATARYFEQVLADVPGVTTHVLDAGEGRANFVAVLEATNPTARPVLVMGHMDVVGVNAAAWETPPFEAVVKDGYVHGRGAIDCKGPLAAELVALLALAAERDQLTRNIVFLATAAEEGGPSVGIDRVLEQHRELLGNPEFALNEGGRVRTDETGQVVTVNVQVTEKLGYNVNVTATGPSGHGSVPLPDNALAALARAVERVHAMRVPPRLTPTTRLFFQKMAQIERDDLMRAAMRKLLSSGKNSPEFKQAVKRLAVHPQYNAILRTGCALTRLDGGFRSNVIPSSGTAIFNTRVIPGDDILEIVESMNRVGGESAVTFELQGEPREPPPASPVDTPLYLAMQSAAAQMQPEAVVIPFMSTGATDSAALRRLGIPTYGILPIPMPLEDELRMHGDNERAPLAGLGWAAEYIYRVLRTVAG